MAGCPGPCRANFAELKLTIWKRFVILDVHCTDIIQPYRIAWLGVGGRKGKLLAFILCSYTFELFPLAWEGYQAGGTESVRSCGGATRRLLLPIEAPR